MWKPEVLCQQLGDTLSTELAPPRQHYAPRRHLRQRGENIIPRVNGALSSQEGPVVFFSFNPGTETERGWEEEDSGGDRSSILGSSKGEQRTPTGEDKDAVAGGLEGRTSLWI